VIKTVKYPPHELAQMFPRPSETEKRELGEHIEKFGLQEPIILFEGKVLDGVSRQEQCAVHDIQPRYAEFMHLSPDIQSAGALNFVIGRNLKRRHLSPSQRAMIAAELIPAMEKKLKEARLSKNGVEVPTDEEQPKRRGRPPKSGKASAAAAAALGVSPRSVERATEVLKKSPKKAKAIKEGKTKLGATEKEMSAKELRRIERVAAISRIEKVCGKPLADAVDKGARLKTHKDVVVFTRQSDGDMKRQAGLIEIGWKLAKAMSYKSKNLTRKHKIDDLLNEAAAEGGAKGFNVEIDGWSIDLMRLKNK
jgi:hypothetical protein